MELITFTKNTPVSTIAGLMRSARAPRCEAGNDIMQLMADANANGYAKAFEDDAEAARTDQWYRSAKLQAGEYRSSVANYLRNQDLTSQFHVRKEGKVVFVVQLSKMTLEERKDFYESLGQKMS